MLKAKSDNGLLRRTILSACCGTILEWYDFSIYAYLAAILAKLFFQAAPSLALLLSYSVFAIGYIARPGGALLFGHMGDTRGRKKALSATILLMASATFTIGLLPTYQSIGIIAPILLIVLRLLQGLAVGGESFGSACFIIESISSHRRGLFSSLIWASSVIGMLCASLMVSLIFWWFQGESLYQWGWRIAFLFAAFSGFIGFYIRAKTMETSDFQSLHEQCAVEQYPLKLIVASHKLLMIQLIGLYLFSALVTYLAFIFMPIYLTDILNYSRTQAHTINTVMLLLLIVMDIFFGALSDKIGRKGLMFTSAISLSVLTYPLYYLLLLGSNTVLIAAYVLLTILAGAFQGPLLALTIDLVPVSVRYTLGSLSYNLAYSFFGGTAPILALSLINKTGNKAIPGAYLALGAVIATFSLFKLTVKKARKVSLSTTL